MESFQEGAPPPTQRFGGKNTGNIFWTQDHQWGTFVKKLSIHFSPFKSWKYLNIAKKSDKKNMKDYICIIIIHKKNWKGIITMHTYILWHKSGTNMDGQSEEGWWELE